MEGGDAMMMLLFLRTTGYYSTSAPVFQLRPSWFYSSPNRRFASFLSRACAFYLSAADSV
jgi:hypothetical protein